MMTFTGRGRAEIEEIAFQRFPILHRRASQAAGTLSGGEQQMLALARGLATDPPSCCSTNSPWDSPR
ncbi:hypothetical protein O1M63_01625 [Streptomyces mirabilis]|nr:hypothetical protein [Streptomyces mirabilis]